MKNTLGFLLSYAVQAVILWQYASALFTAKHTKLRCFMVLLICHFLSFVVSFSESIGINVTFFMASCFLFMIQYQLKWYLALFHSVMLTIFLGLSELLSYNILASFAINFFYESNNISKSVILVVFSKTFYFFITYILRNFFKEKNEEQGENGAIAILFSLIPLFALFIVITFILLEENTILPPCLNRMIAISAIFLFAINFFVLGMYQYTRKKSQEFTQMQLLLQKESSLSEYYKMLLSQKETQSILIHDIKKHLQSIALLSDKGEPEKINTYIHQLLHSSDLKETVRFCDQDLLNAVLYRYQRQCQEENIDFLADIRSKTMTFLADYDLTSLFGNLLDNALEAARGAPHAYIEISTCQKENAPFVVITMVNSCLSDPFSKTSGRLISLKSDPGNHGFGIKSIQKIVNRYGGDMQMYYQDETHTFHTVLTLHRIP